jgi:hypothetical protein
LNGNLQEQIFMSQPEGYEDGSSRVCRLVKSLYGLKQAPRCWNVTFTIFLKSHGLEESDADPCLFVKKASDRKLVIVLYVDDGLVAATHQEDIEEFFAAMSFKFTLTRCPVSSFLGMQIVQMSDGSIFIHQGTYTRKILERFNMSHAKAVNLPMERSVSEDTNDDLEKTVPYQAAVGSLLYLSNGTRPDITFAVNTVARYMQKPKVDHWNMVKKIMRYLIGTESFGILYKSAAVPGQLVIYSDADFAGDAETRRSTTGYTSLYSDGAITWSSQRQSSVSLSTTEAEFVAASQAVKETLWLIRLFDDVCELRGKPTLMMDNQSAIRLIHNPELHKRSKHIEVRHFFVRDVVTRGDITVKYVSTEYQRADIFTKALSKDKLFRFRAALGMCDLNDIDID